MLIHDLLSTAARGITVNKKRSALTMLGIVIGVASVVLMVSIGRTFQGYIMEQIASIGTDTLDIFPTGLEKFGKNLDTLTEEDYHAIDLLPTVDRVAPVILVAKSVHYGKEEWSPMVMGTTPVIFGNYGLEVAVGRLLTDADVDGGKNVAVIGSQTAADLFGDLDPLGKRITVGEQSFTVVGVLKSKGSLLLSDLDKPVYIPYTTARTLTGQRYLTYITLKTVGNPIVAKADIVDLLRRRHRIDNPEDDPNKDDFVARSAEQVSGIVNSVTMGLTVFLALIAGVSLLVGGIGIMNIMLVSVSERTKEIGLRKAVGATSQDILLQFLCEAVALTLSGGLVGMIIGGGVGWMLTIIGSVFLGTVTFVLSASAVLAALVMAIGTGLIFGLYPAKRAASLSPMEALRFE
jgi:putative ABC transport system permease protein